MGRFLASYSPARVPPSAASLRCFTGGGLALVASLILIAAAPAREPQPADRKPAPAKPGAADVPVDEDHPENLARGLALFRKAVRQTLVQHCLKCHGGEAVEAEFDLADRAGLLRGGQAGPAIEPGRAKSSRLLRRITHADKPGMPFQAEKLSERSIAEIAEWIELGAPYDEPLVRQKALAASWIERVIPEDARGFWSFRSLARHAPPAVRDAAWRRNDIDRFLLAKLEAKQLRPNGPASREHLLRRAAFGLTGLPPTPGMRRAFLADESPDAWSRQVDRLLDSPQYGERWARHWLDIARFAESHGFEHDTDRPTAYHYRDFVIEALNRDLPYDAFVRWQIAGDEFAPHENLALMATGFLAAGVHSTQITKNEVEKHRYDELDDMLGTIGQSMLGLSIQCARCHDHKFDAIPQRDYYEMLATFTTTVRSEVDLDFDPEGYRKAKSAFDAEHAPLAAELARFEREELPARLAAWEAAGAGDRARFPWVVLEPATLKSAGGATLTLAPDGAILATGTNPQFDTYTFEAPLPAGVIRALRVEALAHPGLVKGGPGRADNGNFDLTEFRAAITPATDAEPAEKPAAVPLALKNPRATFEQTGLGIALAIDENEKSGWAVDPQFGKDHAAAFDVASPIESPAGSILTLTLVFRGNDRHNLGRVRLSVATAETAPALDALGLPQAVASALDAPAGTRSAEQQARLLKWYATLDQEWQKRQQAVEAHLAQAPRPVLKKVMISSEGLSPVRLHSQGGDYLEATHYLRRGDPGQKEAVAAPGFLQALRPADLAASHWSEAPPEGWRTTYRRRALANWLTDVDRGAGALLARVIVNRVWQHHFGRGIVATPNDFGVRGAPPTHPELLDWLASEFVASGWSLKHLHRIILASAAYRQSSAYDEERAAIDRENALLWRRTPVRLEAEVIRDSLLAVSGRLDPAMYGPGTLDEASRRRSIYFTVKRSKLIPMMQVFDAPDALSSIGERPVTTIAPQALLLMNNPQSREAARASAGRVAGAGDAGDAVRAAYELALAREPTADELAEGRAFIDAQRATYTAAESNEATLRALADFCQVVLCLNEFVYIE